MNPVETFLLSKTDLPSKKIYILNISSTNKVSDKGILYQSTLTVISGNWKTITNKVFPAGYSVKVERNKKTSKQKLISILNKEFYTYISNTHKDIVNIDDVFKNATEVVRSF